MENLFSVGSVFAARVFCIPDYQRGYAWETQHCQDFVEDLDFLGKGKEHFMGLLIVHPNSKGDTTLVDEKGNLRTLFEVVDGQQRLTTLVLLLDGMRREMQKYDNLGQLAVGLKEKYVTTRDLNGVPRPILSLNRDTHGFFRDTILEQSENLEGATIRSHQLLLEAKRFFSDYLTKKRHKAGDDYPDWLKDQYLKIAQQLTFVVYTVEDEADAGVVFETMNNRGKELTELEKVKNYLLYLAVKLELRAVHTLVEEVNATWTLIFERLMAADLSSVDNEDQLLRAHWLMAYVHDPKKWKGSRSIKEHFSLRSYEKKHAELLSDLLDYLAGLRNAAVAYCDLYRPSLPNAFSELDGCPSGRDGIVSKVERLGRLGLPATFLPLLIASRIRSSAEAAVFKEALDLTEKFVFRVYRWMERPSYTGRTWMFRLGNELYQGREPDSVFSELRQAIMHYCSDQQFEHRFNEPDRNWFHWTGLKYFLYEYEQYLADKANRPVKMPWEKIARKKDTIEHILPQTPRRRGYWRDRFSPQVHQRWVHDIGNLTLTYDNSVLGRKPFPEKMGDAKQAGCYASSMLFVERDLLNYQDWTAAEIQARRQKIVVWARDRWHVAPGESREKELTDSMSVAAVVARAGEYGIGESFEKLLDAAQRSGLHVRPFKKCVMLAPPTKRNVALLTIWPKAGGLDVGVWAKSITHFYAVAYDEVVSALGWDRGQRLDESETVDFAGRLERFFETLEPVAR